MQAIEQQDLLTTAQADRFGFGKDARARMVADGHWRREANGLYDLSPGHTALDKRIWAAALFTGSPCAIGGEAALHLHGLPRPVGTIVVWVPDDRRPRSHAQVHVRRDKLDRVGRATGWPARVRVEDALVDVGQQLPPERLVELLSDAFRLRVTTADRVRATVASRRRVHERARFKEILADLQGIESTLEYLFRRDVERAHALPTGRRQASLRPGQRTDVLYEEQDVMAELDGRVGHEDAASAFRDLRRDNAHAVRRFTTLRYGSADVRGRPCEVARQVWQALSVRGWGEPFRTCPRCR